MSDLKKAAAGKAFGEDKKAGVVFVAHPVTPAQKKAFRAKGQRIVDVKFGPEAVRKAYADAIKPEAGKKDDV